jgi:hypothetical protein
MSPASQDRQIPFDDQIRALVSPFWNRVISSAVVCAPERRTLESDLESGADMSAGSLPDMRGAVSRKPTAFRDGQHPR